MTYEQWLHEHYMVNGPLLVRTILSNIEAKGSMAKVITWGQVKKEAKSD